MYRSRAMRRTAQVSAIAICICAAFVLSSCQEPRRTPRQASEQPSMLGELAPAFVTVDPDGNEVDLKAHLGKDVIMLDFWATWCGPCIVAMPEIADVAEQFKDRGLVFYAVNVGEDPDSVK